MKKKAFAVTMITGVLATVFAVTLFSQVLPLQWKTS